MDIERAKPRLDKNDILKAFGDRVLMKKKEKTEQQYLDISPKLTKQLLIPPDTANQYDAIGYDDCLVGDPDLPNSPRAKPLHIRLLKEGENPVSLIINKVMWRANENADPESELIIQIMKGDLSGKGDREVIDLGRERKNEIGSFRLSQEDDVFEMPHRYVREDYRGPQNEEGERFSSIFLNTCEQIVKNFSVRDMKAKTIEVDSGQLDVMTWLSNNQYQPKGESDETRFKQICNADGQLCVVDDLYIFEEDKVPERNKIYQNRHDAYTVAFEKTFQPDSVEQEEERAVELVRDNIKKL